MCRDLRHGDSSDVPTPPHRPAVAASITGSICPTTLGDEHVDSHLELTEDSQLIHAHGMSRSRGA